MSGNTIKEMDEKNMKKDVIELGKERWEVFWGKAIEYSIVFEPATNTFFVHYNIKYNNKEIDKIIRKDTALIMLSRMDLNEDQEKKIKEILPEFEKIKLEIQMHDRQNNYDFVLSDKYILRHLGDVEYFHFAGEHVKCRKSFPHPPHILFSYSTVRYGPLYYFCTGKSGVLRLEDGRKVKLTVDCTCTEDCWGTYTFELVE